MATPTRESGRERLLDASRRGIALALGQQAGKWAGQKTFGRKLLAWELRELSINERDVEPLLREWIDASAKSSRTWQAVQSFVFGFLFGSLSWYFIGHPLFSHAQEVIEAGRPPGFEPPVGATHGCQTYQHLVDADETWEGISRRYAVPSEDIASRNGHSNDDPPPPGEILKICSYKPFIRKKLTRQSKRIHALPELPEMELPSASAGSPSNGELQNGILLPDTNFYDRRCNTTAFSTKEVGEQLMYSLALLRLHYQGQIVIGDISRKSGGLLKPHKSHQSGRDIDIWLPVIGGKYEVRPGCSHCRTPWCQPKRSNVDWGATWLLIEALVAPEAVSELDKEEERSALRVKVIFLSIEKEEIYEAAREYGASDAHIEKVMEKVHDDDIHLRHLHVRYECPASSAECLSK